MTTNPATSRATDFRRLLQSSGIRVTGQRLALLRAMARLRGPISHPELTQRIKHGVLDRATIYRNLLSLTKAGLLVRTHLGDNVWRYELPRQRSNAHRLHPHFVCTDCGDVACLSEGAVTLNGRQMRERVVEVQLRGVCPACERR